MTILRFPENKFQVNRSITLLELYFHSCMRIIKQVILFCTAALLAGSSLQCRDGDLLKAHMLLESGDYLAARNLYEPLVKGNPRDFESRYGLGMSWSAEAMYKSEIGMGEPEDWYPALYHMTVATHLRPERQARNMLAIFQFNCALEFRNKGDKAQAIATLQQAIVSDSTLAKAHNLLGALYQEEGDFDRAEQAYRRLLALNPDYAIAHFNLGALAWSRGDFPAAEKDFGDALALEPDNTVYAEWLDKARSHLGTGRP
jgi:tetratricopeptide (TPR) repeat protein